MKKRNLTVSKLLSITMLSAVLSSASAGTPFLQAQVVHAEETTPSEGEGGSIQEPEIKEIHFDKTELALKEGETATLAVIALPQAVIPDTTTSGAITSSGAISAGALIWSSSNEAAAKVENGVVTAVKEGTAVIKAALKSNQDITASCNVTITAAGTGNPGDGSGNPGENLPAIDNTVITDVALNADGAFVNTAGEIVKNAIVQTAEGTKYITDNAGKKITETVVTTADGTMYCTLFDGAVAVNKTVSLGGRKYFAKADGAVAKNEFCTTSFGNTVYANEDGTLVVNKTFTVNGKKYFAKKSGAIAKSAFCTTAHGNTVYANKNGTLAVNKTFTVDGKKYFAKKSGAIAKSTFSKTAKGNKVYSNAKGELITNRLFKVDGSKYYAKKSGAIAVRTWVAVGGKTYYCSASGRITKTK